MEVGNDSASFLSLFFGFEMDDAIWNGKVFAEAPFVAGAEAGWDGC